MKRRSFLKGTVAAAFSAPVFSAIDLGVQGKVRALTEYDLVSGEYIYRYDISDGNNQYAVSFRGEDKHKLALRLALRKLREDALMDGVDLGKLIDLPILEGMEGRYYFI